MKSRFIYWLVYSGMWLFSALPFRILYLLSDFNYLLMYRIGRYRRKVVRENLKKSFPEKDKKERLQIERRFYRYLSDYMLEDLKMLHMSPEDLYKRMTYKNTEQYLELTEKYGGTNVKFIYAEGCDLLTDDSSKFAEAIATARRADIVLAAMGEDFNWSGEAACRTDLKLPGAQQALLKELKKTGKPLGLILVNGRPLDLSWEDQHVDGILEAWYLGTMAGHGMADVISGDYNPSARLTMSFPRTVGQLPLYYNQKPTGRPVPPEAPDTDYKSRYMDVPNTTLYPFGYGLSYTTFAVNSMKLDQNSFTKGGKITVTAEVENTGKVDGETVVQMYIRDLAGSVTRPVKELKGFEKVALKAGEKKQVSFTIDEALLAFYGIDMQKKAEPGDFTVWVGLNSADETNQSSFSLR